MIRAPAARAATLAFVARPFSQSAATYATQRRPAHAQKAAVPRAVPSRRPGPDRLPEDSYQLAERVKHFVAQGQLDEAISVVRLAPLATVVVWNQLIHEILRQRKYKLAWDTWMDMKRRGIEPSARGYSTFFAGFAAGAADPHSVRQELATASGPKDRVKAVYAQWLKYAQGRSGKRTNLDGKLTILPDEGERDLDEISVIPTNAYIGYLANAKDYQLLLETFAAMPTEGPLAPNSWTYTLVLNALRGAVRTPSATPGEPPVFNRDMFDAAMSVWRRMDSEAVSITTQTVSIVIQLCREAERVEDQLVGLDVAERLFGIVPGSAAMTKLELKALAPPKVPLDTAAVSGILTLALELRKFNLVVALFNQIRDYPERFGHHVLDYHHCDIVLVSLGQKKDSVAVEELIQWMQRGYSITRPRIPTWTNAMQAYWRDADLPRAYELLKLMTGTAYAPVSNTVIDPRSPVVVPSPYTSAVPRRKATHPDPALGPPKLVALADLTPRLVCTFLQTALATRDRGKIAHALSTVKRLTYGAEYFIAALAATERRPPLPGSLLQKLESRRNAKTLEAFWRWRLADAVENAVDRVLSGPEALKDEDGLLSAGQRLALEQWADLAAQWKRERGNEKEGTDLRTVETMAGRRRVVDRSRSGPDALRSRDAAPRQSFQEDDFEVKAPVPSASAAYVAKERSQSKNWTEGTARLARTQDKRLSSSGSGTGGRFDGRGGNRAEPRLDDRSRRDDRGYESDRSTRQGYGDERPRSRQEERPWTPRSDDGPRSRPTGDRPRSRSFESSSRGRERPSRSWGSGRWEER